MGSTYRNTEIKRGREAAATRWLGVREADAEPEPMEITQPMRKAVVTLAKVFDYDEAARAAGVDVATVRDWAHRPEFIYELGAFVIGLTEAKYE